MRPCQVFSTLEALRTQFSGSLSREGVELSFDDTQTVLEAYQQWLSLAYDLEYLHPDTLQRDAHRLFTSMVKVDVLVLLSAMAECYKLLQLGTNNGFKVHCATISPHLFPLIREDVDRWIAGDLYAVKRLIQLFSYLTRLSLRDIDLSQQCISEYLFSEENIPESLSGPLILSLNSIVKRWFGPFVPYEIVPAHGPGSVADVSKPTLLNKYKALSSDAKLRYAFGCDWWCARPVRVQTRTSKTIFVPKSYKTFRTISMEPTTLQYFQQGVWKVIDKYVNSHSYLRNHIGFHDETRNRRLAQLGSVSGHYATLDLSSASDSVSYDLVKKVFRGTWLLRYLVATRSTHTLLPDDRIIQLRKFAPMGSALCFPTETILFAALCEHVTRELGMPGDFSVYGDDIIVPFDCADMIVRALTNLGFRVNTAKSFISRDCHYRESCGGEYIDGFDVTPMRISRRYNSKDYCDHFSALISLANSAYERNFYVLRHFFLMKMRQKGIKPHFSCTSLLSGSSTNYHLRHRWNRDLQREEVRAASFETVKRTSPHPGDNLFQEMEEIRYRHWLETTYNRKTVIYGFESYVGEMTERIGYRWFPVDEPSIGKDDSDESQVFGFLG